MSNDIRLSPEEAAAVERAAIDARKVVVEHLAVAKTELAAAIEAALLFLKPNNRYVGTLYRLLGGVDALHDSTLAAVAHLERKAAKR